MRRAINLARLVWHILGQKGDTMSTPADIPNVRAVMVPLAALTDADWHDVFMACLPDWQHHRRCGTVQPCYRKHADRFDYLLDEWLEAHRSTVNTVQA